MRENVFQKDWFAVFKVKVTVKDHIFKIWLSDISSAVLILLQLNLVWWHIIISWIFLWKDWIALLWSRSRSQERFKIPANVHLDNISSTAELFVTKLGMVMHRHGQECCARGLVCNEGSYYKIWLFIYTVSTELLNFLQPNSFWMVHHHKLEFLL